MCVTFCFEEVLFVLASRIVFVRCAFWILSTHSSVKVDTLLTHFVLLWSGPAVEPHALAGEDHEILNV